MAHPWFRFDRRAARRTVNIIIESDAVVLAGKCIMLLGFASILLLVRHRVMPIYTLRTIVGIRPFLFWVFLCMTISVGVGIFLNTMISSFVGVRISEGSLSLDYCWPLRDVVLNNSEIISVTSRAVGKGHRAYVVIVTTSGDYSSGSMLRSRTEDVVKILENNVRTIGR